MRTRLQFASTLFLIFVWALCHAALAETSQVPGEYWRRYVTAEEAGFSSEILEEAKAYFDSYDAAALMVIYNGAVLVNWGETARRFRCHSSRKSFMSAMYGVYIDNGTIDSTLTLEQLGIDDSPTPLTLEEKQAKIVDLLTARSGIYLLAAYEPAQNPKPPRGSFPAGTNWCYNNWDFNTLLTIFEQQTGKKFFDAFDTHFAKPLRMQDFDPSHGYYHYEPEKSSHPAYPFRMSARDMARFGLLFLNNGQWDNFRILSDEYVRVSTSRISDSTWTGGYGYMWWLIDDEPFKSLGTYSALGLGEQSIDVIPGANMVIVQRTNTFTGERTTREERYQVIKMILDARVGEPKKNPNLVIVNNPEPVYNPIPADEAELRQYTGTYEIEMTPMTAEIAYNNNNLTIEMGEGPIPIYKLGDNHFIIEDCNEHIYFEVGAEGRKEMISARGFLYGTYTLLNQGQFDTAINRLQKALTYYPDDPDFTITLGDAYLFKASVIIDSSIQHYRKTEELYPDATLSMSRLAWWLPELQGEVIPCELTEQDFLLYAGSYGPRRIEYTEGSLLYTREGNPGQRRLNPLSKDLFAVEGLDYFRIRFNINNVGEIVSITGLYNDGREDVSLRTN